MIARRLLLEGKMDEDVLDDVIGALKEEFPNMTSEDIDDGEACDIQISTHCTVVLAYDDDELHIRNLASRGNGDGTALIAFLREYTQGNDITLVAKKVVDTAESFWDKMGFERIGLTEDFILVR